MPAGARGRTRRLARLPALALIAALVGCEAAEELAELATADARTAHEAYAYALREGGLAGTALAREWLASARSALESPVTVEAPYREVGYLPPEEAAAVGYRLSLRAGQVLTVAVSLESTEATQLFLDLFQVPADSGAAPARLASAERGVLSLEHEAEADGDVLVRVQPELLRGGRYVIDLRAAPALAFPVEGLDSRAISSFFGADRDGGARSHHGVDIFAPRGTPAVAAAEGWVTGVRETPRGGKVVWVRDGRRGQALYYAHLDVQLVAEGERVRPGDTLGLIGNTGNARTTPPHLHFGIYRRGRGPLNPYPFIHAAREGPPRLSADTSLLGRWARTAVPSAALRARPGTTGPPRSLAAGTALRVLGGAGERLRVRLPDGGAGFLASWTVESATSPLEREVADAALPIRERPTREAAAITHVAPGESVPVLGRYGRYLLVRAESGREGWLEAGE